MTLRCLPELRPITERPVDGELPLLTHPEWDRRHEWLVQGTTSRGEAGTFDLSLFGATPVEEAVRRWASMRTVLGVTTSIHAPQVHGVGVRLHREYPSGLHLAQGCDGHLTRSRSVLLTVMTADCVPVTLVDPSSRSVAVLHSGWRGTAAGMAAAGVGAFRDRLGIDPRRLEAHLGPSICGECYEVGPEVHAALGLDRPSSPTPVDLRAVLARDLIGAGVPLEAITVSSWCTRCAGSPFFSHRAGHAGRQVTCVARRA